MRRCLSLFILIIMLFSHLGSVSLRAAGFLPEEVRILLVATASKMTSLSFAEVTELVCGSAGKTIWIASTEQATLRLSGKAFWQLSGSFGSYEDARRQGEERLGSKLSWMPVYDGSWRVWLGNPDGPTLSEPEVQAAYPNLSFTYMMPSMPALVVQSDRGDCWLYAAEAPLTFSSVDNRGIYLREKSRTYLDTLEVKASAEALQVINQVETEHFVASSLSKEMSPGWPVEALKAQAVAIRTTLAQRYAVASPGSEYLLKDSELSYTGSDSVYLGSIPQAVAETADQIMLYDQKPIDAVFHADAGGHTLNSEDVWFTALPYLRGVAELFPSEGPDAYWTTNPGFSGTELQQKLIAAGYADPGTIQQIVTEEATESGAALRLRFVGSKGEVTLDMGKIRSVLQLKSNNVQLRSNQQLLVRSRLSIVPLADQVLYLRSGNGITAVNELSDVTIKSARGTGSAAATGDTFVFAGGGWGHGVGLSQWGARAMAEHGYDYRAILLHYYTGVTIN